MQTRTTSRKIKQSPTDSRLNTLRTIFLVVVGAALALESESSSSDPMAWLGFYFHSNVSSWLDCSIKDCSLKFADVKIILSPLEISLIAIFVLWLIMARKRRQFFNYDRGTLFVPLLVFAAILGIGLLNGVSRGGGDFTIALWEVRSFLMMIVVYFLAGIFLTEESHINSLVWVVFIAAGILATDNILRWWFLYRNQTMDDLAYDHIDSMVLTFAALLCMNLLLFGGTRNQRRYAVILLPVIVIALEVMKRRAAFAVLGVGVVVLVIVILRLRPRLFWKVVVPCLFVVVLYLAAFWDNTGTLGQPARAISSMITPDPRDYASNIYRVIERADILANIATSPILGLGFGQPFTFYFALPDLSWWPFWHYTPHNAVLWVWLKDGALGFAAFFWLLARAVYDGSVALESQREQWQVVAALRRALRRRRGRAEAQGSARPADLPLGFGVMPNRGPRSNAGRQAPQGAAAEPGLAWNVPSWERRSGKKSTTAAPSGVIAFVATAICLIPMQIAFSYVDLGLTSERDLLLFGLILGILARAQVPIAAIGRKRESQTEPVRRRSKPYAVPTYTPEEQTVEAAGTVSSRPGDPFD